MSKLIKKYKIGSFFSGSSGSFDIASAITQTGNAAKGIMSGFKSGDASAIKSSVGSLGNLFSMIPTGKQQATVAAGGSSGSEETTEETTEETNTTESLSDLKNSATEQLQSTINSNVDSDLAKDVSSFDFGSIAGGGGGESGGSVVDALTKGKGSGSFFTSPKGANTGSIIGAASDTINSFIPKTKSSGGFSKGMAVWDGAADAISNIPGWGTLAGGIMKGVGTLVRLTDFIGAEKTNSIDKDEEAFAATGGGYGDTETAVDKAVEDQGKYGLFSRKARLNANKRILEAKRQQAMVQDIGQSAQMDKDRESSMSDIYSENYKFQLQGGFNNRMSVGKQGMKIFSKNRIDSVRNLLKYKKGKKIRLGVRFEDVIPRNMLQLVQYAKEKNPRFIQRLSEPIKSIEFVNDDGETVRGTHYLEYLTDDQNRAYIYPRIQEQESGELKFLNSEDAYQSALKNDNYLIMSPEEAELFTENYKAAWPKFFEEFDKEESKNIQKHQKGGTMNVIPEGALHARLHHMDAEGITKKGIPVVVKDKDGNLDQQAEIERNEIIFSLEVTKKLEQLWRDGSDEAAIEAGKILVEEILENTIDNTGLLNEIQV